MSTTAFPCAHFSADRCRSCSWLDRAYSQQLQDKQQDLQRLFPGLNDDILLPPVSALPLTGGHGAGFRNKAKMAVGGNVDFPELGLVLESGRQLDLSDCPLYPADFHAAFARIKRFIKLARLTPYQLAKRRGELKFIQLTRSQSRGEFMLRFVLRSTEKIDAIRNALPALMQDWPALKVVSVNIQPVHMAVQEGDSEILLTADDALAEQLNDVPLYIAPGAFFQTFPAMAAQLYATAREWAAATPPANCSAIDTNPDANRPVTVWDLFCGVGGFGLHCTPEGGELLGIEIAPAAIACATRSAQQMQRFRFRFSALDAAAADAVAQGAPDLLVVNPPRRGIGVTLCRWIEARAPARLIYSSCNAETMARDLTALPDYRLRRLQLFDMFPHTAHYECLALLERV